MADKEDIDKLLNGDYEGSSKDDELKEYGRIISASTNLRVPARKSKEEAWNAVLNKIEDKENSSTGRGKLLWAAASVLALLSFYFLFFYHTNTIHKAPNGEIATIKLPGGSEVVLNAGSSIEYNDAKWEEKRTIELIGEAYFDVVPGKSFSVITSQGAVAVLGTKFNVQLREGIFRVSCINGKVEVSRNNSKVILTKGQATKWDDNSLLEPYKVSVDKISSWTKGEFHYENVTLVEVLEELERQYDIKIESDENIKNRKYSGYFKKKDLDESLKAVLLPMGLEYQVNGTQVQIISNE